VEGLVAACKGLTQGQPSVEPVEIRGSGADLRNNRHANAL
jgi:hypothetical protein